MADARNMQLKVFNQWNGGLENVKEQHLIRDVSFSALKNLDNSTGVLKPQRNYKVIDAVPQDTVLTIKEHVNDCEPLINFMGIVDFVNYGDTVYYINHTSALMQVHKTDSANQTECTGFLSFPPTMLSISGTLTSTGDVDLNTKYQGFLSDIYSMYTIYLNNNVQEYAQFNVPFGNTPLSNSFNDPIGQEFTNINVIGYPPIDGTNLADNLVFTQSNIDKAINTIDNIVIEMSGTLTQRCSIISNLNPILTNYFVRPIDTAFRMYNRFYDGIFYHLNGYGAIYAWTFILADGWVWRDFCDIVIDDSITKYIVQGTSWRRYSGSAGVSPLILYSTTVKGSAVILKDLLVRVYTEYLTYLETNAPLVFNINANHEAWFIARFTPEEMDIMIFLTWYLNPRMFNSFIQRPVLENPLYTIAQREQYHATLRSELGHLRNDVKNYNLSDKITLNAHQYKVVGYSSLTKAYSNALTLPSIYNDTTVNITGWDTNLNITDWYVYRKRLDEQTYQKVGETTTNNIDIAFDAQTSSVLGYENQIALPHDDYIGIAEHKGVIFLARENSQQIWFTEKAYPSRMSGFNFINASQNVKAITSNGAGVIVWTTNRSVYLINIGNTTLTSKTKDTIVMKQIAQNVGILSSKAFTVNDNNVVWLSQYGFHNTSGFGSAYITENYWLPPNDLINGNIIQMLTIGNKIYTLYHPAGAGIDENNLIIFEPRKQSILEYNTPNLKSISEIDGTLHGVSNNNLVQLFKGLGIIPFEATLKRFCGYSYDVRQRFLGVILNHDNKPFKDIERNSDLRGGIKIEIDCRTIGTHTFWGCTTTEIELPNDNNEGYSIQLTISGSLKVNSVRIKYLTHQWED